MSRRISRVLGVAALTMLGAIASATVVVAEEARYCVTVQSGSPIGEDWISAVVAGEATIIIDEPGACAGPVPTEAGTSGPTIETVAGLLATIRVATETPFGYDRDRFRHWVDADRDGCDARDEVLIAESLTPVTIGRGCRLAGGRWLSAYDGIETSDPSDFDVDHVVPLAEAWRSGAREWDDDERETFANDLDDGRVLRAVTASSNRSKSDQDPSDWLPPAGSFHCAYVSEWVAIKVRWDLAADPSEKAAIADVLATCGSAGTVRMTVSLVAESEVTPARSRAAPETAASTSECDPSYPDTCIAPPPPDLDCRDIAARRFEVSGADPHGFDGDADGVGCES